MGTGFDYLLFRHITKYSMVAIIDLTESANLNFGAIQKAMYALAIAKMKLPKEILQNAQFNTKETDEFWVSSFDVLYQDLSRKKYESAIEAAAEACAEITGKIASYYGNAWNFQPGYKPIALKSLDSEDFRDAEIIMALSKAIPTFAADYKQSKKDEQKKMADKTKSRVVAAMPNLPKVLELLKKYSNELWSVNYKFFQTADDFTMNEWFPNMKPAAVKKLALPQFKALVLKDPKGTVYMGLEGVEQSKSISKEERSFLDPNAWALTHSKSAMAKMFDALK